MNKSSKATFVTTSMSKIIKNTALFALIFSFVFLLSSLFIDRINYQPNFSLVCIKKSCFNVEVVDTPGKMQRGLMFRENLDKDKGMLFIFEEEGNYPFWMKNTLIPLDIIWINQNQEIVFIKENAEPCLPADLPAKASAQAGDLANEGLENNCPIINPNQNSKYVLEINGGVSQEINLKLGDNIFLRDVF